MRINRPQALAVSALLHALVFGAGMVSFAWFGKPIPIEVTPVTLMTSAEMAKLMAAEAAEVPETATAETPAPEAEPLPPAPLPAPEPKPAPAPAAPKPAPAPAPSPKPSPKAPATPAPKTAPMNLDALADSLAKASPKTGGAARPAAPKGPTKLETDLATRPAEGQARATSQTALNRLVDQLNRAWQPACGASGAPNVVVRLRLNQDGSLQRAELVDFRNATSANDVSDPALRAAATLALSASARASPYLGLPREDYSFWNSVRVVFDGKKACERL